MAAAAIASHRRGQGNDDLAGGCCDDTVPMPATCHGTQTAGIDLGELAAFALGGKPLRRAATLGQRCTA